MTTEKIVIIMLLYILLCVAVYYIATKYFIDRKRKNPENQREGKSIIDELEIETNIFDVSEEKDDIDGYEIDSPYKKNKVEDLLRSSDKKGTNSGIRNKIRRLLE